MTKVENSNFNPERARKIVEAAKVAQRQGMTLNLRTSLDGQTITLRSKKYSKTNR